MATKRRKRGAHEARDEGLAAARELLLSDGPAGVTLANVGKRIGMSHTNVIHHFGSAADLGSMLMGSMVRDLSVTIDEIVAHVRSDAAVPTQVVNRVFDTPLLAGSAG